LLRKPFPAQAIAIMGLAKRWQQARTGMVVAECGTGKTLISLGAIHVHSEESLESVHATVNAIHQELRVKPENLGANSKCFCDLRPNAANRLVGKIVSD
jgi:hypothetical protein